MVIGLSNLRYLEFHFSEMFRNPQHSLEGGVDSMEGGLKHHGHRTKRMDNGLNGLKSRHGAFLC